MTLVSPINLARCTDAQLLEIGARDAEAFGVFYDRHEDALLAFFRRATGRADLAADLTAEVFACALASLDRFDSKLGQPKAWLFGIARHELAQTWRRGRVEAQARRLLGMEPMLLSDEDLERIDELGGPEGPESMVLLEELPGDQRTAVMGRVLEERDYPELAHRLGCSELVVRQRVSRGLRTLRSRLGATR
jgi:RNA polymerase sigma factor (sigma-70 family)